MKKNHIKQTTPNLQSKSNMQWVSKGKQKQ